MAYWRLTHDSGARAGVYCADTAEQAIARLLDSNPPRLLSDPDKWHGEQTRKWIVWGADDQPISSVYADTEKRAYSAFAGQEGFDSYAKYLEWGNPPVTIREITE